MILFQSHLVVYSLLFGVGLVLAIIFLPRRLMDHSGKLLPRFGWSDAPRLIGFGLGVVILTYVILLIGNNHSVFLLKLVKQGDNTNTLVTLALGMLGIVMTLVTIGVISVADRAVTQLRALQSEANHIHEEFEHRVDDHRRELDIRRGHVLLLQERLRLTYINQRELETEIDNANGYSDTGRFRLTLSSLYACGSDAELLSYLCDHCPVERLDDLRDNELAYLRMLDDYYGRHSSASASDELRAWGRDDDPEKLRVFFDKLAETVEFRRT